MNNTENNRITVKFKCPNPLFEEWLINWRDEAASKGSKQQYTFSNALQSLRRFPLPLNSGGDCKILKGFGNKLCRMLDNKLNENSGKDNANSTVHKENNVENFIKSSGSITVQETLAKSASKKKKSAIKDTTETQYSPQNGSGGYAILITLYKQSLEPEYSGSLKKSEIIQFGKNLSTCSFTKPDPGSRYTAWSSMRTLVSKKLISKHSHPPKFSLTEEGKLLAKKLYENAYNKECTETTTKIESCNFNVSNSVGLEVKNNQNADFRLHDLDFPENTMFYSLGETKVINNNINNEGNYDVNVTKTKIVEPNIPNSDFRIKDSKNIPVSIIEIMDDDLVSNSVQPLNSIKSTNSQINGKELVKNVSSSNLKTLSKPSRGKLMNSEGTERFKKFSSITATSSEEPKLHKEISSLKKSASSSSLASTKSTTNQIEHFIIASNNFDIILYVDIKEITSSNHSHSELLTGLIKQKIKHEVKDLKVGDFTWICRDRITKKELVLPYIIERKRMDDFASSIKDKRYHEQKFRLKRCGIENLIYLIENYGKNLNLGLPLQTLYQAASYTAIQDNFFIKFTENMKETIDYIANFSKTLVNMFKSKTLASCSKEKLQTIDINEKLIKLMTFSEFNENSIKNKKMRVTDLLIKMLIQIKGMSVERALAITEKYPTPASLNKAYEENSETIGEMLLANIKYGSYGKNIGATLSKIIYKAFTQSHY